MRVAVLSDIHGNLPALEAVLAEVEREGVDAVVVAGDVIGGAFGTEVFDRLASLPDVRIVRGNADRFVLDGTDEFGEDWAAERERMGAKRLAAVASWPLTHELDIEVLGTDARLSRDPDRRRAGLHEDHAGRGRGRAAR